MVLGAIADDVTGGTDLASTFRQAGLTVLQTIGLPDDRTWSADAIVVSLKIRTVPPGAASAAATAAAALLLKRGARQLYFKYCSTFDSTDEGNIGPVTEALLDALGAPFTVACPAYPGLGRSVYKGHLFVGDRLLSESPMRNHPLTPMLDSDLVRVLGRQCRGRVGLVELAAVEAGVTATRARFAELARTGHRIAIADAVGDQHLDTIGAACADLTLVTGAAGLGRGLALQHATPSAAGLDPATFTDCPGNTVLLSGSCSAATQAQVNRVRDKLPCRAIDPLDLIRDAAALPAVIEWACDHVAKDDILVYSTAGPDAVQAAQNEIGTMDSATLIESAFRALAAALAEAGVRKFVVAGGETSGAVLEALGVRVLAFGSDLEPGVPWAYTLDPEGFRLALKSGNFGSPAFFEKALGRPL